MDNQTTDNWGICMYCAEIFDTEESHFDDICDYCAENEGYDIGKGDGDGQPNS